MEYCEVPLSILNILHLSAEGSFMCWCIWHASLAEKCLHHKVL